MKILIVDDEPITREILKTTLERLNHQTAVAADGEQAAALMVASAPQVILSDWMMPKMDGLELCRKVRSMRRREYPYFILLTARTAKEDYLRAMEAGADDFLAKPLREDELLIRLKVAERILGFMGQVGELKRLLPICSYCKKIRDDKDYWQQIESYIHRHTGVDFSHSICPECYEKHIAPYLRDLDSSHAKSPG